MVCRHLEQLFMDIKAQGITETSVDQNQSENTCESIYVDCFLDSKSIRQKHAFPDFVTDYITPETDDTPKEGLVCNQCDHAIIGLHKEYVPGCKTFGYDENGQAHVFYFENSNATEEIKDLEKPLKEKKKRRGLGYILLAILLAIPIALYQYLPHNMKLGFVGGFCSLILVPLVLSSVTQKIRGKDRYTFPLASVFISLLIGTPSFILYGWRAIYYFLAVYSVFTFVGSIILRLVRSKA